MSLKLHVFPAGPIETNAYLLTDAARGEAVLIDAPGDVWTDVEPVLKSEGCELKELWLTHGHWVSGAQAPSTTTSPSPARSPLISRPPRRRARPR